VEIYFFTTASRPALGPTQHPIQWISGAFSLSVKRPGRAADRSLHLVPRSRMFGGIIPLPQYAFMEWCSVKQHTDKFTFTSHLCLGLPSGFFLSVFLLEFCMNFSSLLPYPLRTDHRNICEEYILCSHYAIFHTLLLLPVSQVRYSPQHFFFLLKHPQFMFFP
jgi:hypothetical protein